MKHRNEKQHAGVCLDANHAIIIAIGEDKEAGIYDIQDKLKMHDNGGGGSEHSMNNAKQTDTAKYFKTVSASLLPYDEILLFGPGKSQEQFHNFLKEDAQFNTKKITVDSADHLTDPQMIAKVRDFFKA